MCCSPTCKIDLNDPDSLNSGAHGKLLGDDVKLECVDGQYNIVVLTDECHEVKVVHVKTKKVGYLIGHHGRTIKGFENSSGAKIDILVANSMSDETPV